MATFTTRPVKAGLPTLFQIQEAARERPTQLTTFQTIALVAIADELSEVAEQLRRLPDRREEGSTC
jgi:hypothetical protein